MILLSLMCCCRLGWSQNVSPDYNSPEGYWYSAPTKHQFGSVFHVFKVGDEIRGIIATLIPRIGHPDDDLGTRCSGCDGELKDHPTIGLPFIWGFKKDPASSRWINGKVLDPRSGNAYSARMETVEGGRQLKVRGYLGSPVLGANVYWTRVISTTNLNSPLPPLTPEQ